MLCGAVRCGLPVQLDTPLPRCAALPGQVLEEIKNLVREAQMLLKKPEQQHAQQQQQLQQEQQQLLQQLGPMEQLPPMDDHLGEPLLRCCACWATGGSAPCACGRARRWPPGERCLLRCRLMPAFTSPSWRLPHVAPIHSGRACPPLHTPSPHLCRHGGVNRGLGSHSG